MTRHSPLFRLETDADRQPQPASVLLVSLALVRRRGRSLPEWLLTARELRARQRRAAALVIPADAEAALVPALECEPSLRTYSYGVRDQRPVGIVGDGTFVTAVLRGETSVATEVPP